MPPPYDRLRTRKQVNLYVLLTCYLSHIEDFEIVSGGAVDTTICIEYIYIYRYDVAGLAYEHGMFNFFCVFCILLDRASSRRVAARPGRGGAAAGESGRHGGYAMLHTRKHSEEKPSQNQSQGVLSQARNLQLVHGIIVASAHTDVGRT